MIIERIDSPNDLKSLNIEELKILAKEIREYIIQTVSNTGGHLAPSLGTVELTLALHYVFDAPMDKIIFDVGHQAYTHKIITGRREAFKNLRKYKGLSGFTNRKESEYDPFGAGHVGTAISSALGFAVSRDLKGGNNKVIAVVGDGGLTAGMSYEGLNNAGFLNRDFIVVLNDNEMSIDKNIGGIAKYLARITASSEYYSVKSGIWNFVDNVTNHNEKVIKFMKRVKESVKRLFIETPTIFFEEFGFHYMGPYNGHKLEELIEVFKFIKNLKEPVFVHVITEKGKGYKKAEENPTRFHGLGPFNIESGKVDKPENSRPKYTSVFADKMVDIGKKYEDVVAITAAMPQGTGLVKFREHFGERFYDVGIAEQHAVTFAGGLAAGGMHPFVAIYSTFLQRAYDSIIHDVALQNLPVVFCIDRAGVVGADGPTHHGTFDIAYLRAVPNMVLMAPKDAEEFKEMLEFAAKYREGPIAIRYPRDTIPRSFGKNDVIEKGKAEWIKRDKNDTVVLAFGTGNVIARELDEKKKVKFDMVNLRFAKPVDKELIGNIAREYKNMIVIEEGNIMGGVGEGILRDLFESGFRGKFAIMGFDDIFITFGDRKILLNISGFSSDKLLNVVNKLRGSK